MLSAGAPAHPTTRGLSVAEVLEHFHCGELMNDQTFLGHSASISLYARTDSRTYAASTGAYTKLTSPR